MLTSMLLNELQKQTRRNQEQADQLRRQAELSGRQAGQIARLSAAVAAERASRKQEAAALRNVFEQRLAPLEHQMAARDGTHGLAAAFNR
jgi:hypothetical protein